MNHSGSEITLYHDKRKTWRVGWAIGYLLFMVGWLVVVNGGSPEIKLFPAIIPFSIGGLMLVSGLVTPFTMARPFLTVDGQGITLLQGLKQKELFLPWSKIRKVGTAMRPLRSRSEKNKGHHRVLFFQLEGLTPQVDRTMVLLWDSQSSELQLSSQPKGGYRAILNAVHHYYPPLQPTPLSVPSGFAGGVGLLFDAVLLVVVPTTLIFVGALIFTGETMNVKSFFRDVGRLDFSYSKAAVPVFRHHFPGLVKLGEKVGLPPIPSENAFSSPSVGFANKAHRSGQKTGGEHQKWDTKRIPQQAKQLLRKAAAHFRKGELEKAELLYRAYLQQLLKTVGHSHAAIPVAFKYLAFVLRKQERWQESGDFYQKAIAAMEKTRQRQSPNMAVALEGVVEVYMAQGRLPEALPYYRRALVTWNRINRSGDNARSRALEKRFALLKTRLNHPVFPRVHRDSGNATSFAKGGAQSTVLPTSRSGMAKKEERGPGAIELVRVRLAADFLPVKTGLFSRGSSLTDPLSTTRPKGIVREPTYQGQEQRYGWLTLGTSMDKIYFYAFDQIQAAHPVLFFDRNRNGDLTDDGGPLRNRGSGWFATEIRIPIRQLITEIDREGEFAIWFFVNEHAWKKGFASHYSRTNMKGTVVIAGKTLLAYIGEWRNNDADFTNDGIFVDSNGDGKIDHRGEFVRPGGICRIGDKGYRFEIGW